MVHSTKSTLNKTGIFVSAFALALTFVAALFFSTALIAPIAAQAAGADDPAGQEALKKTQDMLRDKAAREKAAGENAATTGAHDRAKSLGGSAENTDKIYDISADVLDTIFKQAAGDPNKMQELVSQAQKDPEAFLKSLPPEQRAKIKSLSEKIERENASMKANH